MNAATESCVTVSRDPFGMQGRRNPRAAHSFPSGSGLWMSSLDDLIVVGVILLTVAPLLRGGSPEQRTVAASSTDMIGWPPATPARPAALTASAGGRSIRKRPHRPSAG